MDRAAGRARAGKATIYRRWPSKVALVMDAITSFTEQTTHRTRSVSTRSAAPGRKSAPVQRAARRHLSAPVGIEWLVRTRPRLDTEAGFMSLKRRDTTHPAPTSYHRTPASGTT
jgi:AcrR family transcriptional regulator